jgi:isochorismate synthase
MRSLSTASLREGQVKLIFARAAVSPEIDALALLESFPEDPCFLWECPATGEAIAAIGAVYTIEASGADRFGRIAREIVELGAARETGSSDRAASRARSAVTEVGRPLVVGGFAFDATCAPSASWHGWPSACWWVPRLALVRRAGAAMVIAAADWSTGATRSALEAQLDRALAAVARPLRLALPTAPARYELSAEQPVEAWCSAVEETMAEIAAGRLDKLVLSRSCRIVADVALSPLRVLRRLRLAHPGSTVFAVGRGASVFVGATPELLASVRGGELRTTAVAGTVARGGSAEHDRELAESLRASVKERREHALVVEELGRALLPLCSRLEVPAEPELLTTDTLRHLRTPIHGELRDGVGLLDVVERIHPTPAIAGAPRARALAALRSRERESRGWYGGGVGWLDGRDGAVSVAIRAALLEGRTAHLQAGAGIVAGSSWEAELEEVRLKLRPLLAALVEL